MIEVEINQDIRDYKTKLIGPFTTRQVICLVLGGGTVKAAINLIERLGGEVVSCLFLTELAGLNGRKALEGYNVESVVVYEGK